MDRPTLLHIEGGGGNIERLTKRIEDVTLGDITDRHRDRSARILHLDATDHSVGRLHRDGANQVVADVLRYFESEHARTPSERHFDCERVIDRRHRIGWKLDVDDRTDDACDTACGGFRGHYSLPALAEDNASAPPTISLISWVISA
ncbi:unannotated protein [freshwater metagenome]|uniref:Unannotated protein n=1 Tax=freshwater metagenome TaxID=449393 RepID=A0A6J6EDY3_9ZZZZ